MKKNKAGYTAKTVRLALFIFRTIPSSMRPIPSFLRPIPSSMRPIKGSTMLIPIPLCSFKTEYDDKYSDDHLELLNEINF